MLLARPAGRDLSPEVEVLYAKADRERKVIICLSGSLASGFVPTGPFCPRRRIKKARVTTA